MRTQQKCHFHFKFYFNLQIRDLACCPQSNVPLVKYTVEAQSREKFKLLGCFQSNNKKKSNVFSPISSVQKFYDSQQTKI